MAWLAGWQYRRPISISRPSGAVSNYQMKISLGESFSSLSFDVNCRQHCKSDFSDIRFTTADGTTLLDYWIESTTGTTPNQIATIWVEFDYIDIVETTFYMYYGNTEATAVSNGAATFPFFDDFLGSSLDLGKWTSTGLSYISVSSSVAYLNPTVLTTVAISASVGANTPSSFITEARYQRPSVLRNRLILGTTINGGNPVVSDSGDFSPSIFWGGFTGITLSNNIWYISSFRNTPSAYSWYIYNDARSSTIISRSGASAPTARYVTFMGSDGVNSKLKLDWALTRNFSDIEPTFGDWGNEYNEQGIETNIKFNLYWSFFPGVTKLDNEILDVSSPSVHEDLTPGIEYYYAMIAYDVDTLIESDLSNEVSAVPYDLPDLNSFGDIIW